MSYTENGARRLPSSRPSVRFCYKPRAVFILRQASIRPAGAEKLPHRREELVDLEGLQQVLLGPV